MKENEQFKESKRVIRRWKAKNISYNDQKKKEDTKGIGQQNTRRKTSDWATLTPYKMDGSELMCPVRDRAVPLVAPVMLLLNNTNTVNEYLHLVHHLPLHPVKSGNDVFRLSIDLRQVHVW